MHFNPAPDDRIEAGDFLIAMGEPQQLRELELTAGSQHENRERGGNARDRSRHLGALRSAFLTLMENAGSAVARFILADYPQAERIGIRLRQRQQRRRWIRVARKLVEAGRAVRVLLLCGSGRASRRCGGDVRKMVGSFSL
jgi:hypothetical protein